MNAETSPVRQRRHGRPDRRIPPGQRLAGRRVCANRADGHAGAVADPFAGGTVTKTELDSENGKVIYTVHLTDSAGKKQEAKVDATTGTLLPAEAAEGPETRGTPGAPETGETQD